MQLKRVVVTGLGALTPIGNSKDEYWKNLLAGVSGAAAITHFDASLFKTQFACEVKNFNVEDVHTADEVFVTGTFAGIIPVISVDQIVIGNGMRGEITKILQDYYTKYIESRKL